MNEFPPAGYLHISLPRGEYGKRETSRRARYAPKFIAIAWLQGGPGVNCVHRTSRNFQFTDDEGVSRYVKRYVKKRRINPILWRGEKRANRFAHSGAMLSRAQYRDLLLPVSFFPHRFYTIQESPSRNFLCSRDSSAILIARQSGSDAPSCCRNNDALRDFIRFLGKLIRRLV